MPEKKTKAAEFSVHTSPPRQKGRSLFFGIGINEYQHFEKLGNAVKDINDVVSLLEERYEIDEKILLLNEEATGDNITNQLEDLVDLAQLEDKVIIYYSGHGVLRNDTGYWVPVDGEPGRFGRFIRNQIIHGCIKDIQARHILLISDSCFSGSLVLRDVAMSNLNGAIEELEKDRSRWVLSSGRQTEKVADGSPGENSPFARSILKVLRDNQQPKLNVAVLADKVIKLTRYNWEQMPQGSPLFGVGHEGGQYIFCLHAGASESRSDVKKEEATKTFPNKVAPPGAKDLLSANHSESKYNTPDLDWQALETAGLKRQADLLIRKLNKLREQLLLIQGTDAAREFVLEEQIAQTEAHLEKLKNQL